MAQKNLDERINRFVVGLRYEQVMAENDQKESSVSVRCFLDDNPTAKKDGQFARRVLGKILAKDIDSAKKSTA